LFVRWFVDRVRMTAVRPLSQFNILKALRRAPITRRRGRKITVAAATTDIIGDVSGDISEQSKKDCENEAGFCGESFADNDDLLSSLSPLLTSMKLFGLYFHREVCRQQSNDDPEWSSATSSDKACNKLQVYATVVLILMWLNAVRFALVFTRSDYFGAILLMKIALFNWYILISIFQTAYYYASHSGKLRKVLSTLPVTRDCVHSLRRATIGLTAYLWATLIGEIAGGVYVVFNSDKEYDFILAPFVTYIHVPKEKLQTTKILAFFVYTVVYPNFLYAHSMSLILVYIFYTQFKQLKKNFCRALGERGHFNGDLSLFRRRNQTLSRAVNKVDGFMKMSNVAGFVCHIINIVILLYSIMFYSDAIKTVTSTISFIYWMFANIIGLLFSASAGVIVNHMVRSR